MADVEASYSEARTLARVADGLTIGGTIAAAVAIVLWIVGPFDDSDATMSPASDGLQLRF
jgi:hypothetical protein